jgi:hypothetical protein
MRKSKLFSFFNKSVKSIWFVLGEAQFCTLLSHFSFLGTKKRFPISLIVWSPKGGGH